MIEQPKLFSLLLVTLLGASLVVAAAHVIIVPRFDEILLDFDVDLPMLSRPLFFATRLATRFIYLVPFVAAIPCIVQTALWLAKPAWGKTWAVAMVLVSLAWFIYAAIAIAIPAWEVARLME